MPLMRAVVAVLVVLSMVIFPVSMVPAGVGAHHGGVAAGLHDHPHQLSEAGPACDAGATGLSSPDQGSACHRHQAAGGQGDAGCCGGIACHSVQLSGAPLLFAPARRPLGLAAVGEEQLASALPDRLDRPPRTV